MRKRPDATNLPGPGSNSYTCESGAKYKYFGSFFPHSTDEDSGWEIYLYHYDKVFPYDSVSDSPDLLAKLSGPLLNISMDRELLRQLAVNAIEAAIETWDQAKGQAKE